VLTLLQAEGLQLHLHNIGVYSGVHTERIATRIPGKAILTEQAEMQQGEWEHAMPFKVLAKN
jgi:hypothetical protein